MTTFNPSQQQLDAARVILRSAVDRLCVDSASGIKAAVVTLLSMVKGGLADPSVTGALEVFERYRNDGSRSGALRRAASSGVVVRWLLTGHVDLLKPSAVERLAKQRDSQLAARQLVVAAVTASAEAQGCSLHEAILVMVTKAKAGLLEGADLLAAVDSSSARKRKHAAGSKVAGVPSVRTLHRWLSAPDLIPKTMPKRALKPWVSLALSLAQGPGRPSVKAVHEAISDSWEPAWGAVITYSAVWRVITEARATRALP